MRRPDPEYWYHRIWLPLCSFTYIGICLFDFVIMPVYTASINSRLQNTVIEKLENRPQDIATLTQSLITSNVRQWDPLTLRGGGLFHLAFGAILSGGAVTRGFAKKTEIDGYYKSIANGTSDTEHKT